MKKKASSIQHPSRVANNGYFKETAIICDIFLTELRLKETNLTSNKTDSVQVDGP